ncbi:MAG TPA: MOSC N-terminal beta barrel domain-containing protein [Caulobacteraceae bacterium]|jgi:hypothetical protein|nr:MOSC N-terminal beta barrel domain-containing protein [Caulobacteraceae bacterium]
MARIAALYVHPVKGFTPQPLDDATLVEGEAFPHDRLWAVEDGPCGFDPAAPAFTPKSRFAVLAKMAAVARVRTDYDPATGVMTAEAPGAPAFLGQLTASAGARDFEAWFSAAMARLDQENEGGPYRLVDGRGWRFTDHPLGHVSVLNLASVHDLAERIGRPVDPLRFRANVWVEGWPAWAELGWEGMEVMLGAARARVFKPIVRCAATQVDPDTAERDIDIPAELHRLYGHVLMGAYVQVSGSGAVAIGDLAEPPA